MSEAGEKHRRRGDGPVSLGDVATLAIIDLAQRCNFDLPDDIDPDFAARPVTAPDHTGGCD